MHRPFARPRLLTGLVLFLTAAALTLLPAGPAAAKATPECAAGGVKVMASASPATVTVNDTATGTGLQVLVTITGTSFTIAPTTGALDNASWCLKASTKTQNGTGTSGASTIPNKQGTPQVIGYLVVYTVTTGFVDPVGSCWDGQGGFFDYQYNGPINTLNNAFQTNSQDGTCTGGQIGLLRTIVQAPDQAAAAALCLSVAGLANAANMQNTGGGDPAFGFPAAPADYWSCF